MPKCTLYLSDEDNALYKELKAVGENPSAILAKALRQRSDELSCKANQMTTIPIFKGTEYSDEPGRNKLEIVKFDGKLMAKGVIGSDPNGSDDRVIYQELYETKKGNYLLYEVIEESLSRSYGFTVIEKNKPLPERTFAKEILEAVGKTTDVGTFLDI